MKLIPLTLVTALLTAAPACADMGPFLPATKYAAGRFPPSCFTRRTAVAVQSERVRPPSDWVTVPA
ncbi:hypothetical protein GobsT_74010 [Gemmata obscuriglobus]|nr:hypothetical protein GobsT_74010 [Gemmata obscuriglobus]VTS11902.1 unnamed protein product [Gemmata obscuriglobus UQM 2246]